MRDTSFKSMLLVLLVGLLFNTACNKEDIQTTDFGIFSSESATVVIMNGEIGSHTPQHWDNYIAAFPSTRRMIMKNCPGSSDDTANLEVARKVRLSNLSIHLPADAEIASGAVDFFLAGTSRTRDNGSRIGVHSWSDGNSEASDFPVGHSNHDPYIEYYKEMGFSQVQAEAFYYFTINAAPAAGIHWMTDSEIEQYKLLTL